MGVEGRWIVGVSVVDLFEFCSTYFSSSFEKMVCISWFMLIHSYICIFQSASSKVASKSLGSYRNKFRMSAHGNIMILISILQKGHILGFLGIFIIFPISIGKA